MTDDIYGRFSINPTGRDRAWSDVVSDILERSHVLFLVLLALVGLALWASGLALPGGRLSSLTLILVLVCVGEVVVMQFFLRLGDFMALGTRGLTVRSLFSSTIPYEHICVLGDFTERSRGSEGRTRSAVTGWSFRRRWFIHGGVPNLVLVFHVPVRLGLWPFVWYRAASFLADRPQEFLDALRRQLRDRGVKFEEAASGANRGAGSV